MRYGFLLLLAPLAYGEVVPGRYIVELTGDSVAGHVARHRSHGGMRGPDAETRRAALRSEQTQVRQRFSGAVDVLGNVENVGNALLVSVNDAEAARLRSLPGVRRVLQVRTYKRVLDRAVVVNKVTEAWNQIGDDKAGQGIKIGIIDTGVDNAHPGLRDGGLTLPSSYPRTNDPADESFTSNKVIVARSYVSLLARRDSDSSARDHIGHGTALAVIAAGTRTAGPLATIQGVAPRAYIGSYKVFGSPGVNDGATNAAILKAIDDAVADGMDIINLSLGDDLAPRLEEDPLVDAVEKATKAGVLVVCAAGNNGPDFGTISSPATARSAIAVGATRNDRTFGASVDVSGSGAVLALRSSGIAPAEPVGGPIADVSALDSDGLACAAFPSGSLTGKVALILRGSCTFEAKLNNAQRAGAIAALVYATAASPEPITMAVGAATLPAEMISYANGTLLKDRAGVTVSLRFTISAVAQEFDKIAPFSAIGPNVDLAIKPDLVAVGESFYVATQSFDPIGEMYSADGYALVDGTSFSSPLVAGALALLKAARPGLSVDQYRSLLVNASTGVNDAAGDGATMQKMGAGQLHLGASLRARAAALPAALSLGTAAKASATLHVDNLGEAEVFALSVEPKNGGAGPVLGASSLEIAAGQGGEVAVSMSGESLPAGAYEGFIKVAGLSSGSEIRVPYWFAVTGREAKTIPVLAKSSTGRRNATLRNAIYFRVTDASGVPIADARPEITVLAGGGDAMGITSLDSDSPGLFSAAVRLGPAAGVNTFRLQAGEKTLEFSITAQ